MLNRFGRPSENFSKSLRDTAISPDYRQRLLSYVLLTGGNTVVRGFDERIKSELTMLNPVGMPINVVKSYDAHLDSWRGGALLA